MRAYVVTATSVVAGLRVLRDPHSHVLLGTPPEDGSAKRIYIAPDEFDSDISTVYACDVLIQKNKKRMLVPESKPSRDALVIADIRGADGSETAWSTARPSPGPCSLRLQAGDMNQACPICNTTYVKSRHPDEGDVVDYRPFPPARIEILNRSWVRHGTTHKPPWAVVYMLRMQPGSIFRVYRGNVEDGLKERFVCWNRGVLSLGSREQILD